MSHTSREKLDLVNRTKKVIGQLEAILRALNDDEQCADVLQRLATARGSINSLMAELMEDHIRNHMPRNTKSSEEAADDLIGSDFRNLLRGGGNGGETRDACELAQAESEGVWHFVPLCNGASVACSQRRVAVASGFARFGAMVLPCLG